MDTTESKTDQIPVPVEIPLDVIGSTERGIENSHRRQRCLATDTIGKPASSKASQLLCECPAAKVRSPKIWLGWYHLSKVNNVLKGQLYVITRIQQTLFPSHHPWNRL